MFPNLEAWHLVLGLVGIGPPFENFSQHSTIQMRMI